MKRQTITMSVKDARPEKNGDEERKYSFRTIAVDHILFEENLEQNLDLFTGGPLMFHEPVWGVEHSAPKGSADWEKSMFHLQLTRKYAEILHPASMVVHLNNCAVPPDEKGRMLRTALENLEEMREMFPGVKLLVENTGTKADGTILLDQAEFTDLCRERQLPVLIDIGHANANGWDLPLLIRDLQGQIGGFHLHNNDGIHDLHNRLMNGTLDLEKVIPHMDRLAPDAPRVIEYSRTVFHGEPLLEDIETLKALSEKPVAERLPAEKENDGTAKLTADQMNYILRSMNEAVCLAGKDGELIYANHAAEKLFGIRAGNHQRIWDAIPFKPENDALIQLFLDSVVRKKGSMRSMADYVNNDGDIFHLYVNLTCEPEDDGLILVVIND